MNKKHMGISAVIALGLGVIGFFGGVQYGQTRAVSARTAAFRNGGVGGMMNGYFGNGANLGRRGGMMGGFTGGQIISKDDKSVTIKTPDGGSKIIFYSASTSIDKSVSGTASDLAVGQNVTVSGTPNSDGSIAANTIGIRPNAPAQSSTNQSTTK